jgi:cytochrome c oxidase accessory protein FixG
MTKVYENVDRIEADAVNKPEQRSLYAARVKIHPKRAQGTFRTLKWWVMAITLAIYYVTPWLRWDRGLHAPDQAVLVDLANRRFYFFFIEIWPQEFYFVGGLLVMAGVGLFLLTSTVGRAWCGYTCPQTVWVDLFLVIERFVEGDRNARIKLDAAPWSLDKITKRVFKHAIWLLIAVSTGGAWIFYFADAPSLARDFITFNAAPVAYSTVAVLTGTTYIFAGFMREQVCTYMCPWPRIQGAMLDEHSLTVTYNDWRGEPRGGQKQRRHDAATAYGDCIDCNLCVAVCPAGIDIRDGQQLECIACALCIDACNSVMAKTGRPSGLISYSTLADYTAHKAGTRDPDHWPSFIRPRTFIYIFVFAMIGLGLLVLLAVRDRLNLNVLHDRNPVYVQLSDGTIRNGYTVKILNKRPAPRTFRLSIEGLAGAGMYLAGSSEDGRDAMLVDVEPDRLKAIKVYVRADPKVLRQGDTGFSFVAIDVGGGENADVARTQANFEQP